MADTIRSLQGTQDIYPVGSVRWQYIERVAREVASVFGFDEIRTPIIERTDLFVRSVGDTTDIVQKEMYSFEIGDENITIRPEGTAGVARSVLQTGALNNNPLPLKYFYIGPFFRRERPQAGRYRQFHQFGIECYGAESPAQDAEIIVLAHTFFERLGIQETALHINSIGCPECRPQYYTMLKDYYRPHLQELCEDCQNRFERNPLRLLDCKKEQCQPFKANAPRGLDHLCENCSNHFEGVKAYLAEVDIPFQINPDIVRGLDYYNRTVFEFISGNIGAQSTICGGGRYDGLLEQMGGKHTPAFGFGIGLERLLMTLEAAGADFPKREPELLYLGSMGEDENRLALKLATALRVEGFKVAYDTVGRSVRAQMKYADRLGARYSCIIGGNELEQGTVDIRQMETGEATSVPLTPEAFCDFFYKQASNAILESGKDIKI